MRSNGLLILICWLGLVSVAAVRPATAQENDFPLWPFDESSVADEDNTDEPPRWTLGSRLTRFRRRSVESTTNDRNDWQAASTTHEQSYFLGQNRTSVVQVVANTPRRMAGRMRSMWDRSLDMLRIGDDHHQRAPRRRPILGRLFGSEPADNDGPRTISEWMEQDRLGP